VRSEGAKTDQLLIRWTEQGNFGTYLIRAAGDDEAVHIGDPVELTVP
jgi:hypothetical protein